MSETQESPLPPLYAKWVAEWLPEPLPVETEATCMDCCMFPGRNNPSLPTDPWFSELTKCCAYVPTLPNYLVGAILSDDSEESGPGKIALQAFLESQAVVTPLGVHPPLDFHSRYNPDRTDFGKNLDLRCPYYLEEQTGLCSIWKHRNARCSTWFCKYTRGNTGLQFWQNVDALFTALEQILSRWCIQELEVGSEDFRKTFPLSTNQSGVVLFQQQMFHFRAGEVARANDKSFYKDFLRWTWGNFLSKEQEYYRRCYQLIEPMNASDIASISRLKDSEILRRASNSLKEWHSSTMPLNLRQGSYRTESLNDTHARVWSYHGFDFIDLPVEVIQLLPYFNGKTVSEIQSRIESEKGIRITESMLRRLVDYRILIP